jgi:IgA Peptidase M64/Peptidase M64 N-terminus
MKYIVIKISITFLFISNLIFAQVNFDEYFQNKTLRIDYYHTGDSANDFYSIDELKEEPYWGGSHINLIDKFDYGKYKAVVLEDSSQKEIYSRTYSTLFSEWQTTDEAKKTTKTFSETFVMPFPKEKVTVEFFTRNRNNDFIKKFSCEVDPTSYFVKTERDYEFESFKVQYSGDPSEKVDIVIIPEGYTEDEMDKFKVDCKKVAGYLFNSSPYTENKKKFNIWGIEAPSQDEGTDIPAKHIWKKTLLNTSFYTFDLERYLMTTDNKTVRDVAANAPYDQIYILVNSSQYGGGAIYNYYSVCVSDNMFTEYIFVHELGHGFAYLADEYSEKNSPYKNFYNFNVEPTEPNLTTLVDFKSKWKDLVNDSTPIPTPPDSEYKNIVGAFEGGGYVEEGIYRPMFDCQMRSISINNFCPVCKRAIKEMIDFYSK